MIAFDVETTGLSPYHGGQVFAVSTCDDKFNTYYWEFSVNLNTRKVLFNEEGLKEGSYLPLIKLLTDPEVEKVGHNTKFDLKMLKHMGIEVQGKIHDTLIAAKACYTNEPTYGLKELARKYVDFSPDDEQLLKKQVTEYRAKAKKLGLTIGKNVSEDYWLPNAMGAKNNLCKLYNINDSIRTMKLWKFYEQGMKELKVRHTYNKEMRLYPIVIAMEERGVRVDSIKCLESINNCTIKMADSEVVVKSYSSNKQLNLNSPKQLIAFLYDTLQFPVEKVTPSGQPSTDSSVLKKHKNHPAISALLEYRGLEKGIGYFKGYLETAVDDKEKNIADLANWKTKCLHPWFHQWGANTGRFSCSNPNLQNVSNDETSGGESVVNVRQVFVPREGFLWLSFDYSQLELRIFASRAQERKMLDAFKAGRDIHDETRRAILSSFDEKHGRKIAKNINFLKVFGGGANTLSEKYDIPIVEARDFLQRYSIAFPRMDEYIKEQTQSASKKGYIINAFNRKVYTDPDRPYAATNYDVQSSAADLMKNAMIRTNDYLKENEELDCHLILTIHDELVFEVSQKKASKSLAKKLKELIEDHSGVFSISTPVEVSYTNTSWADKTELEL